MHCQLTVKWTALLVYQQRCEAPWAATVRCSALLADTGFRKAAMEELAAAVEEPCGSALIGIYWAMVRWVSVCHCG